MNRARKKLHAWIFDAVLPVAMLALFAWYVYSRQHILPQLFDQSLHELLVVCSLAAIGHYVNSVQFALLYRAMGAPIRTREHWLLYAAGQVGNHAPGNLGTLYRFRYLNVVHNLPYLSSVAAYSLNFVVSVIATGFVGLGASVALGFREGIWSFVLLTVFSVLMLTAGLVVAVPTSNRKRRGRIGSAWIRLGQGWERARSHRTVAIAVLVLEITRFGVSAWRLEITFAWLGFEGSFYFFLVVAAVAAFATTLAITPAGLGIREVAIAIAAAELGQSFEIGLLSSSTDRAINILVVLLIGVPGIVYSSRRIRRTTTGRLASDAGRSG